ncbi:DUF177 domain-containing protein [Histidinibacterium aquaticum]|uniref:DUF177 domain-containing protein n=1 Tax=Histidinibacterium aquaticum TaxID=2613962 RepID=A0A5J5GCW2_9RHOB|nr:DUF177 domain-containing protein [Histidinibacterium aquaticum]
MPSETLRLADLAARDVTERVLEPDAAGRAALAAELGIEGIRKFRFAVTLTPRGKADWSLDADLGATVVQACVVTLDPVTTRIDERISRRFLADWSEPEGGTEIEMPDDETAEPLPATLDLYEVALEALALALPPYPRADGVEMDEAVFAEPGTEPLRDEDLKPFAGLKDLKDRLGGGGDEEK